MAQKRNRYRAIYSILLDDEGFQELTAPARHLFLTLKISRFNNLAGIFLFGPGEKLTTYKYFMGISEKAFNRAFKELQDTHWIAYQYPILWVCRSLKHEPSISLENEKQKTGILKIIKDLPKLEIVAEFCTFYALEKPFDTPSNGYRHPFDTGNRDKGIGNSEIEKDKEEIPYQLIIDDLNKKLEKKPGRGFEVIGSRGESNRNRIRILWKKGFKLEDFFYVHNVMIAEWKGDPKMEKYLQPPTLHSNKFENYVKREMPKPEGEPF
jgi:uncharacterized phage protein (TIGR02220 family)